MTTLLLAALDEAECVEAGAWADGGAGGKNGERRVMAEPGVLKLVGLNWARKPSSCGVVMLLPISRLLMSSLLSSALLLE